MPKILLLYMVDSSAALDRVNILDRLSLVPRITWNSWRKRLPHPLSPHGLCQQSPWRIPPTQQQLRPPYKRRARAIFSLGVTWGGNSCFAAKGLEHSRRRWETPGLWCKERKPEID